MDDDQLYRDVAMAMVMERLFNLAIERTSQHREFENGSQQQEEKKEPQWKQEAETPHYDD